MPRKKVPATRPRGRPKGSGVKITADQKTVDMLINLAKIQCTQDEVAAVLGVDPQTFNAFLKQHPEVKEQYYLAKEHGKSSLRRLQFKHAQRSVPMTIWLGKQYLKQTDKHATDITGGLNNTVQISVVVEENEVKRVIDHEPEALILDHVGTDDKTDV